MPEPEFGELGTCLGGEHGFCYKVSVGAAGQQVSGNPHAIPATVQAADAEQEERLQRLLRAWMRTFNGNYADFGTWEDGAESGLRRIAAGLAAMVHLPPGDPLRPPDNFPQLVEQWLYQNAKMHADVGTDADFDFHLTSALTILNAFGDSPLLTDHAVEALLMYDTLATRAQCGGWAGTPGCVNFVPYAGDTLRQLSVKYDLDDPLGTITIPETENHVLMINTWIYLANQWIRKNPRNHPVLTAKYQQNPAAFQNDGTQLEQGLLAVLGRFLKNGYFETNARPYQGFTLRALMQLAAHADGEKVRIAARNAVDFSAAMLAFQAYHGKRYAPMRRLWGYRDRVDL